MIIMSAKNYEMQTAVLATEVRVICKQFCDYAERVMPARTSKNVLIKRFNEFMESMRHYYAESDIGKRNIMSDYAIGALVDNYILAVQDDALDQFGKTAVEVIDSYGCNRVRINKFNKMLSEEIMVRSESLIAVMEANRASSMKIKGVLTEYVKYRR